VTVQPDTRTLWYTRCPMPSASSIAITDGWLDREFEGDGVAVRSLRESPDPAVRLGHYRHEDPALFREGGIVPPLWTYARGTRTKLLAVGWEEEFRGVIALAGSGIVGPEDLRGRRIALPARIGQPIDFARAISWHGIVACLQSAGIDESEVGLVDVSTSEPFLTDAPASTESNGSLYTAWENVRAQSAELLALVRGEVDAIFTVGGYGLEIAALVDAAVVVELSARDPWPAWTGNHLRVLTVSEDLLDRRPDLVTRYVATLQRAADWAAEHPNSALRIIAAELGIAEEWTHLGYHPDTASHLRLEISDRALEELESRADFLADRGFINRRVSISEWLEPAIITATADLGGS
jgi:ABC-type nitrate/sulfonate/bicarbonate transport system substrate-binding protein